jgi:hypothetical protein
LCRRLSLKIYKREQAGFAKVTFGGPGGTVPELLFEKKGLILAIQQVLVSYSL